ncbi:MAG: MBL fold metallo-hydrolase [Opitutus sp.]|nr:MBL fold metallo-hydrolase [Opitutus sp.]
MPKPCTALASPRTQRCFALASTLLLATTVFAGAAEPAAKSGGESKVGGIDWNAKAAPWGALKNAPMDAQKKSPFKIFDNVYYVGLQTVAAYLITTSDGLVLLDATYAQTASLVLENIRALGFDPKNIKHLIVSHAHGDHFAGAGEILQVAPAKVVMSELDWIETEKRQSTGLPTNGLRLKRDVVVKDGETMKVGDTTFSFYISPGHTAGALSTVYQVRDGMRSYRALSPGGLGFNFRADWTGPYLKSIERLKQLGPWDTILANHAYMGPRDLFAVEKDLKVRGNSQHPGVFGAASINAWFDHILKASNEKQAFELKNPAPGATPAAK